MKRQERNSDGLLARFARSASSILYMLIYTIPASIWGGIKALASSMRRRPLEREDEYEAESLSPIPIRARGRPATLVESPNGQTSQIQNYSRPGEESAFSDVLINQPRNLYVGLLDDNPAILDFLETVLTMDGYKGQRYSEGQALLDDILPPPSVPKEEFVPPYDLLILDLLLPGKLSGADVFLSIRRHFTAEQLPIIVITAVDELTLEQFRRILPDDVPLLRKPFPPRVLSDQITQFFE